LAKKQRKATPERTPTKHQLSKWQRQMRIRRIVIIATVVFLAGILSYVGYGYYKDYKSDPLREVVIEVNSVPFTMEYYVKVLDNFTEGMDPYELYVTGDTIANDIANHIVETELLTQGARNLTIEVTPKEIEAKLKETELPDEEGYRSMAKAVLLQEKLEEYFGSPLQLPNTMEQAHVQVMLVENEDVADEVITKIEGGGNFTALVNEFSRNSSIEGDLGWLPEELMPNTLIADAAFSLTPGEISQPIYDDTAIKNTGTTGGCWLVEVIDRGERELEEKTKEELIDKRFSDWLEELKKNSIIENLLDEAKRGWAVNKVLEGR